MHRPERRPVAHAQVRQGVHRHRPDRPVHQDRHRPGVRRPPARRPGRDGHRSAGGGVRPDRRRGRRSQDRLPRDVRLQGHDVQRHPELRLVRRLHQRVVDAARRPDLEVRVPAHQPHGRERLRLRHARPGREPRATRRRCSTCSRATCSAWPGSCPSRAPRRRGRSGRTGSSTPGTAAAATSTRPWSGPSSARWPGRADQVWQRGHQKVLRCRIGSSPSSPRSTVVPQRRHGTAVAPEHPVLVAAAGAVGERAHARARS